MVDKSLKDMTFEDYCRTVFNTKKRFEKPEVLKGIRVVSTTQYILGPACAAYLAELGAETIKVELPKRGEPMRHTTPFNEPFLYPLSRWMPEKGTGLGFFGANPNEYFLSLDFHKPEAIQIMKRLAAKTDVFAENYRAGTFDRWGIGYRQHVQMNPRVIYQWMGGFGGWGPGRNRASYDILGQAQGGCFSITGWHKEYGGMPSKQTIWIMDYWGGAISAFNVLACLYWRDNVSGKGNFLEYSQVHGAQRHLTDFISLYGKTGVVPQRFGNFEPLLCVHGILKCGKSSYPNSKNPQEQEVGYCLVSDPFGSRRRRRAVGDLSRAREVRGRQDEGRVRQGVQVERDPLPAGVELQGSGRERALAHARHASVARRPDVRRRPDPGSGVPAVRHPGPYSLGVQAGRRGQRVHPVQAVRLQRFQDRRAGAERDHLTRKGGIRCLLRMLR